MSLIHHQPAAWPVAVLAAPRSATHTAGAESSSALRGSPQRRRKSLTRRPVPQVSVGLQSRAGHGDSQKKDRKSSILVDPCKRSLQGCSPHHLPATFCPSLCRMVSRTHARSRLSSLKVHRTSDGSHSVKGGCIPRGSPEHRKTLPLPLLLRMYRARVLRPCQNGAKSSPVAPQEAPRSWDVGRDWAASGVHRVSQIWYDTLHP